MVNGIDTKQRGNGMPKIKSVHAREILDSRGNPTVAVRVTLDNEITAEAAVPSGASTGSHEALELRDKDPKRYHGKGVLKACSHVNGEIANRIAGMDALHQEQLDRTLIELDGTENKSRLGANAILGVSLACVKAAAKSRHLPLYRYIGGIQGCELPVPMMNLINGGAHSDAPIDFQEFMVRPVGAADFHEALRWGAEIFQSLKKRLTKNGMNTAVGDEGGFAPALHSIEEACEYLVHSIEDAGLKPGSVSTGGQVTLALDCAASEFYDPDRRIYRYRKAGGCERSRMEQVEYLEQLVRAFPIDSIEDGMAQDDWEGWELLTQAIGNPVQLVGDDLLVTNVRYLREAIRRHAGNAILIKMNQIGTVTETLDAVREAKAGGFRTIISHRSGETVDTSIADLAVALNAGQIKTGSLSRSERLCKYNRLLRIEDELRGAALIW